MGVGGQAGSLVGVLDVGAFSARLLAVRRGGTPLRPELDHKTRLRLDRALDSTGRLAAHGVAEVVDGVRTAQRMARERGVREVYPLATSSIRDARNAEAVLGTVHRATGVRLRPLPGKREAELGYLAARRWYGASAGPLMVVDIGGGTVELAAGDGERASCARSLRLGAREMTRAWFDTARPSPERIAELREYAIDRVRQVLGDLERPLPDYRTVGCSKVLRQLARLAGARPQRGTARDLHLEDLRIWVPRLAKLPPERRAELPGISRGRARQALAGAVVAEALLTVFGGPAAICPWSTTHGLLLTLLDRHESDPSGGRWAA